MMRWPIQPSDRWFRKLTEDEIQELLTSSNYAVVGTIDQQGLPQLNSVYFLYKDGRVWLTVFTWSNKLANLERNKEISLLVQTPPEDCKQVILYGSVDHISNQGDEDYLPEIDVEMNSKYVDEDHMHLIMDGNKYLDGPWSQISFTPTRIIADAHDDNWPIS